MITTSRIPAIVGCLLGVLACCSMTAKADEVWLESLDLSKIEQGWGEPHAAKSVDGNPLRVGGEVFAHGVGGHADFEWLIDLKGSAETFLAEVGVDDEVEGRGTVEFEVWVDGKQVAKSGPVRGGDKARLLTADLKGAKQLMLIASGGSDGINFDHANWLNAQIVVKPGGAKPESTEPPLPPPPVLAKGVSPKPALHGPRIVGTTPGRPLLFLIPATGQKPLTYAAEGLPQGLSLDPAKGIITGSLAEEGEFSVELHVENSLGHAKRKLTIVGGKHKLALTPPMGWNSWNCWAGAVSDEKVRAAADAMVESGLAAHGYQFINIDDCWQGGRDANGEILTNERFPDMKALADYVHSKGLKLGTYSSPGPKTCAGYEGSYEHELQDAKTWAKWGIDYVKHDWCSYGRIAPHPDREALMKPYFVMRDALDQCDRDIVYSLCQYGMGNVSEWGAKVGGNLWRTTGDINDSWNSMAGIGFNQNDVTPYAAPGHWNDPDMLVVGKVGWGPNLHPSKLRPHEQVTHISLWCLQAAPLLIGCDMTELDEFTLALLTNTEVIDVDQDPLGQAARRIQQDGPLEVWAKPLFDGTQAVGLFNRGREAATVRIDWKTLNLEGEQSVRDLWQRKDLGGFEGGFEALVQPHGTVLIKVGGGE